MKRLILTALVLAAACGSDKQTPTVTAIDTSGAVDTSYRGTVQFATDDTRSTAPSEAAFSPTNAGQITAKVVFKTAGARTFVVVDKTNPSALGLVQVVVSTAAPAKVTLEGLPAQVAVDAVQGVTVTVRDAFDNPVTDYAGT